MPRAGRDLELVVAAIERALGRTLRVESPHFAKDRHGGEAREIDVAILSAIEPDKVLVMVECRDRADREDVTWIEQIYGKRESVGADKAIAVSSTGFSDNAVTKGKAWGVELRQVSDLTSEEIARWCANYTIELTHNRSTLKAATVYVYDPEYAPRARPALAKLLSGPSERVTLAHSVSGEPWTLLEAWKEISRNHDVWKTVPSDDSRVQRVAPVKFDDPSSRFCFVLPEARIDVVGIEFHIDCWIEVTEEPFSKFLGYDALGAGQAPAVRVASAMQVDVVMEGHPVKATLVMGASGHPEGLELSGKVPSRNAPCPCGSGKKFKRCCGKS